MELGTGGCFFKEAFLVPSYRYPGLIRVFFFSLAGHTGTHTASTNLSTMYWVYTVRYFAHLRIWKNHASSTQTFCCSIHSDRAQQYPDIG